MKETILQRNNSLAPLGQFIAMILLTKLDRTRVLVTLETIKYIEETPDTLLKFLNGESLIVRESIEDVQRLVEQMRQGVLNPHRLHSGPLGPTDSYSNKENHEHLEQ